MERPKFNEYENEQLDKLIALQQQIEQHWDNLLKTRTKKAIWQKLWKARLKREE
jgi:hypothetical protein